MCCVVFGGTKGIGAAISHLFIRDGFNVAVISRNQHHVDRILSTIDETHLTSRSNKIMGLVCDVTQEENVANTLGVIEEKLGSVNVLVNAAGLNQDQLLIKAKADDVRKLLDVNLVGSIITSKTALKQMMKRKNGCIINIGSIVGIKGNAGQCVYSASKAGLVGFTKSLAKEVASRNIRVNCIIPGYIETDMTVSLPNKDLLIKQIPLERMGEPDEVAQLARFLVDAAYITGQSLTIDGGLHINS